MADSSTPKPPPLPPRAGHREPSASSDQADLYARHWKYIAGGEQFGPLHALEIMEEMIEGYIHPGMYVWRPGMDEWKPITEVPELVSQIRARGIALNPEAYGRSRPSGVLGRSPESFFAGFSGLVGLLIWPFGIVAVIVSIYCLVTRKKKQQPPSALWGIFGLLTGLGGLVIHLLVLPRM